MSSRKTRPDGLDHGSLRLSRERPEGAMAVAVLVAVSGELDLATVPRVERDLQRPHAGELTQWPAGALGA